MSGFRDFNDEGPGTFEWDYVLGGNTTGLFPEETHYIVSGDELIEVTFKHTGGNNYSAVFGDSWRIEDVSEVHTELSRKPHFYFTQGNSRFKAVINDKYKMKDGSQIVDISEIK